MKKSKKVPIVKKAIEKKPKQAKKVKKAKKAGLTMNISPKKGDKKDKDKKTDE